MSNNIELFDLAKLERNKAISLHARDADFVNMVLGIAKITPENDVDFFLHGTCINDDNPTETLLSLFNRGIYLSNENCKRILSTLYLVDKNSNYGEAATDYSFGESKCTLLVAIPRNVGDMFFGNINRDPRLFPAYASASANAGLQNQDHSIIDLIQMDALPPQFILGALITQGDKTYYVDNPNSLWNCQENVDALKETFKKRFESGVQFKNLLAMFLGLSEFNENEFSLIERFKQGNPHMYAILNEKFIEIDYENERNKK